MTAILDSASSIVSYQSETEQAIKEIVSFLKSAYRRKKELTIKFYLLYCELC